MWVFKITEKIRSLAKDLACLAAIGLIFSPIVLIAAFFGHLTESAAASRKAYESLSEEQKLQLMEEKYLQDTKICLNKEISGLGYPSYEKCSFLMLREFYKRENEFRKDPN